MNPNGQTPEALSILLREHREVEQHLVAAQGWISTLQADGTAALELLQPTLQGFARVIQEDLALHIAHEDQALFIVMGRRIGEQAGPIAVMLMEHRHLERQEAAFRKALAKGDVEGLTEAADSIIQVLTAHIMKEEQVLFPMARQVLSAAEWHEVLELIRAQG